MYIIHLSALLNSILHTDIYLKNLVDIYLMKSVWNYVTFLHYILNFKNIRYFLNSIIICTTSYQYLQSFPWRQNYALQL